MSTDDWQWLAMFGLLVLQLVVLVLTEKCLAAVLDCFKSIRELLTVRKT